MMDTQVISILRCPVSHKPLRELNQEEIESLNRRLAEGKLKHLDSTQVEMPLSTGLISADGRFVYPVVDGIFVLMNSLAIDISSQGAEVAETRIKPEMQLVRDYYDQLGWKKDLEKNQYGDAQRFEDFRPVTAEYVHRCHMRVKEYLLPSGKYLLDAASGPVQYPEYLTYSEGYQYRICLDISIQALREAQAKLGDKGLYFLADVANLPLKDDCMDSVVSLHTLYHVPKDEQITAMQEFHRVLRSGSSAVVIYSWGRKSPLMKLASYPLKAQIKIRRGIASIKTAARSVIKQKRKVDGPIHVSTTPNKLYFHSHDYNYWINQGWNNNFEIRVWRSIDVTFSRAFIKPWAFGKQILNLIFEWEQKSPYQAGRLGQYPMFIIRK